MEILNPTLFASLSADCTWACWRSRGGPGGVAWVRLTVDGDGFSVLQDDVPGGHLHGDRADAFPGEGAGHASIQGDDGLLGSQTDRREERRGEERGRR